MATVPIITRVAPALAVPVLKFRIPVSYMYSIKVLIKRRLAGFTMT